MPEYSVGDKIWILDENDNPVVVEVIEADQYGNLKTRTV